MTEELKTIETVDTSPFKRMVMTIGELPTSFVDSMTYYELLAWLCNYLQNTVIPTVNNNAEAVEELQALYVELKTFVDNYFDNLDVQEEINNKLDEMAENGQLTELIAQFLSLNAVMSFPNVASMKLAENLVNGSTCETYGFYNKNDGGGAKYYVRYITNDDVVDEKTIIALYDDSLIAELIIEQSMNVEQFGGKGDETTDDTLSFQVALNKLSSTGSVLHLGEKTYSVKQILINNNNVIQGCGETTVIKGRGDASVSQNRIILGLDKTNWQVKDLKIDVNSAARTNITGSDIAISVNGGSNIMISNVHIITGTPTNSYGIRLGRNATRPSNVTIKNCVIDVVENGFNGIAVTAGKDIYIKDNIINNPYSNTGFAIDVEANEASDLSDETYRINNIYVENNICNGNGIGCIGANNPNNGNAFILNNSINYTNSNATLAIEAILVNIIKDVIVKNNIITYNNSSADTATSKFGITRLGGSNIKFVSNTIKYLHDMYTAIRTTASSEDVEITDNTIYGSTYQLARTLYLEGNLNVSVINNNIFTNADYVVQAQSPTTGTGRMIVKDNTIISNKGRGLWIKDKATVYIDGNYIEMYRNYIGLCTTAIVKNNVFKRLTGSYDVMENDATSDNTTFIYSNNDVVGVVGSTVWNNARNIFRMTYYPSTGTWQRGDIVINPAPATGNAIGWVCTAAGTPGTWAALQSL